MGALFGILASAAPAAIKLAEKIFAKPKSGLDKRAVVVSSLREIATKLLARGDVEAERAPTDEELAAVVETMLAELKRRGELEGGDFVVPANPLRTGQATIVPTPQGVKVLFDKTVWHFYPGHVSEPRS